MCALLVRGSWIPWEQITIDELRAQLALGTITKEQVRTLLMSHAFSNEVTGWAFKYLHPLGRRSARPLTGDNPYSIQE